MSLLTSLFDNVLIVFRKAERDKLMEITNEERETSESVAVMLLRTYEGKMLGEDDTSQPTSRTAPIIPIETSRKKKKRRRYVVRIKCFQIRRQTLELYVSRLNRAPCAQ